MLKIAMRVTLVRISTWRVKITGIGSDANSTPVKMLIATKHQPEKYLIQIGEGTSIEETNGSENLVGVAFCIS